MTAEVALMNRLAVALAADSASTVTYFEDGERKQRYFKGANKIFNLSKKYPVGLMTNGAGTLQKMPWEVIVKAYREQLGAESFPKLADYAKDFFKYLSGPDLFPVSYQETQLITGVSETAGNIAISILLDDAVKNAPDAAQRKTAAANVLADRRVEIENADFLSDDCKKLADKTAKDFLLKIDAEFKTGTLNQHVDALLDRTELLKLAALAHFKADKWTDLATTGIVIAGYGEKELFPSLDQYECFGVVLGTVIYRRLDDDCRSISFDVPSEIVPIAQDDMVYTFVFGASIRSLVKFGRNFGMGIEEFAQELVNAGHLDQAVDTTALRSAAIDAFRQRNREFIREEAGKLRRVVGQLSVGELADLAETFVSIESLKERVTRETESVSGPVDVAVITKGDGFIWVKRKHYFDPALNIRFVAKKHEEAKE